MQSYSGSTTADLKCEICGKGTGNYIAYRYANGLEIQVPMCHVCIEKRSEKFYKNMRSNMKQRLSQIRCDIHVEKGISFE